MTIQIGTPVTYQQALEDMPLDRNYSRIPKRQYPALVLWSSADDVVNLTVFTGTHPHVIVEGVWRGARDSDGRCWFPIESVT